MFVFLALGVAVSHYILGWSSNVVSFVSMPLSFSKPSPYLRGSFAYRPISLVSTLLQYAEL